MKVAKPMRLLAILFCALIFLAGCTPNSDPKQSEVKKDTLTVVVKQDPANMEANTSGTQYHYQVTRQIYETLFQYDEDYHIVPWLCERYEYEDDLTLLLHIRKGVKFHNGDELKASDVYFTFKEALKSGLAIGASTQLKSVDIDASAVVDDYTLRLVTKGPVPTLIAMLENPSTGIICERAVKESGGDFTAGAAVGTGPYKFVAYHPGDRIEMTAFQDYWVKGVPSIKNLTFRIVTDSTSRAIEAETLGSDIVYDIDAKDMQSVNSADGVSMQSALGTNTSYLLLNTAIAPLDNPKVREAVFYGVDTQVSVELAYGDFGSFATGWVCPGVVGYDAELVDKYPYWTTRDVARAKQCLVDAGYPDGLTLELALSASDTPRITMGEAFQSQLGEVGITLKLNVMEASACTSYLAESRQQMCIYGFSCTAFEADRAIIQMTEQSTNIALCNFHDETFQDMALRSLTTIDPETREDLYLQCIEMIMDNYLTLPLWHKSLNAAVSDEVGGFTFSRSYEHHYLSNCYFK